MGSGKTTVAGMLAELGAAVIDADELARMAVEPGRPALAQIARIFGPAMLDAHGRLKRKALAKRVFGDRAALGQLCAIIHPEVIKETLRQLEALKNRPVVVVDVPLLFEAGMAPMMDKVAVAAIRENQRFARLRRRGFSERDILVRLGMQMPQSRKRIMADFVIENSGTLESTREQVQTLWDQITREKSRKNDEC
jgi:dephospho-CoA kinase